MRLPSPRTAALALNAGRVGIGVVAVSGTAGTDLLLGPQARHPATQLLSTMAGARDIAVGAASLAALRGGRQPRLALALGTFCDLVDLVAALRTPGLLSSTKVKVVAAAAPAVVLGTWLTVVPWTKQS